MSVLIYQWKDLLMDFVTGLLILIKWKVDNYNSILVIVDWLTKMVYYKLGRNTIDAPRLGKVIINMVVHYHDLSNLVVIDQNSLFISKFWLSLCYFLGIKRWLSTTFHLQTDGQTKRQNSTMETYLQAFVNFG